MDEHTNTEPEVSEVPLGGKREPITLNIPNAIVVNGVIIGLCVILGAFMLGGRLGSSDGSPNANGAAGATLGANAAADTGNTAGSAPAVAVDIKNVNTNGEPYIGNPQAPVTLAYWSDYQCPYCKEFETTTFQDIVKNYVSTGKVRVVFKDFAFLGPDSTTAALYARAVWNLYPDQFFTWREAMFNAQGEENSGFDSAANIMKLTATISGIDAAKVQADMQANQTKYQAEIDADRTEGSNFGIQGTPSFIAGTKLVSGISPYATFSALFDAQLK